MRRSWDFRQGFQRLNWRYAFGQLALIASGVLIALAVDASWDRHLQRREEREALGHMQLGFNLNEVRLGKARRTHEGIGAKLRALLGYVGPSVSAAATGVEPPDSLLSALRDWQTFDPVRGTLNSLIASGTIGLIRDDSLRIELAAWPDLVADMNEDEREDRSAVRDHLLPLLYPALQYRGLVDPASTPAQIPRLAAARRELLRSRALENWIVDRIIASDAVLDEMAQVENALTRIQQLIEQSLR